MQRKNFRHSAQNGNLGAVSRRSIRTGTGCIEAAPGAGWHEPDTEERGRMQKAFEEEYADVVNCIIALELDDEVFDRMQKMQHEKEVRWLSRLEAKEQSDE